VRALAPHASSERNAETLVAVGSFQTLDETARRCVADEPPELVVLEVIHILGGVLGVRHTFEEPALLVRERAPLSGSVRDALEIAVGTDAQLAALSVRANDAFWRAVLVARNRGQRALSVANARQTSFRVIFEGQQSDARDGIERT
jgi:hypothetical protein